MTDCLLAILAQIDSESEYYGQGRTLAAKFNRIDPLERDFIPEDSICREFIGSWRMNIQP